MYKEDESKANENSILYHDNVSDLKMKYRRQRIYSVVIILAPQIIIFLILSLFLGFYALIGFTVGVLFFLPTPLPPTPTEYTVTSKGVIIGSKERSIFNKRLNFKVKENEMHISISHSWRGEIIRLYAHEPKKLYDLLTAQKRERETEKLSEVITKKTEPSKIETPVTRLSNWKHETGSKPMNIFLKRASKAIRSNPPIILLIIASVLAFFGLITGDLTVSITAQSVFFITMITWGIWFVYKRFRTKKDLK